MGIFGVKKCWNQADYWCRRVLEFVDADASVELVSLGWFSRRGPCCSRAPDIATATWRYHFSSLSLLTIIFLLLSSPSRYLLPPAFRSFSAPFSPSLSS